MGMVLRQLLSNAINFNSSSSPKVEITARQLLDEYLFSVTDNGSGFDPTDSAEIFRMFRKLDRETPGSGMGLAIVKRIIQFHGGRIWAESEKSKGARFHFTLPLVAVR
jgi:signal transduction histidine kinase